MPAGSCLLAGLAFPLEPARPTTHPVGLPDMARPLAPPRPDVGVPVAAKRRLQDLISHHWSRFFDSGLEEADGQEPDQEEWALGVEMMPMSDKPMRGEATPKKAAVDTTAPRRQTHLVVLVHGLAGDENDWAAVYELATGLPSLSHMRFYASTANGKERTLTGIHTCGNRLVEELQQLVASGPDLTHISFIGHSMGGLISRYAIGRLYDAESGTVAGLKPMHFLTMATPHLGCDAEGITRVPLLEWAGMVPFVQQTMCSVAAPVTGLVLGTTGKQFFMQDVGRAPGSGLSSNKQPLIEAMAYDHPSDGLLFFSALEAFQTRTAYANVRGDHLVSWANSSLRFAEELPGYDGDSADLIDIRCTMSEEELDSGNDGAAAFGDRETDCRRGVSGALTNRRGEAAQDGRVEAILLRLQELSWNRVDVRFNDPSYFLAHNHIQVTSKLINSIGLPITRHLVGFLAEMDSACGQYE